MSNYIAAEYNTTVEDHDSIKAYANNGGAISWEDGSPISGVLHGTWEADTLSTSDRRLKDNIAPLRQTLAQSGSQDKLLRELRPVSYNYKSERKESQQTRFGFVANEMVKILPQLTRTLPRSGDRLGLVYQGMLAFLTAMLQGLSKEMNTVLPRLASIENRIAQRKRWKKVQRARRKHEVEIRNREAEMEAPRAIVL